tara:strand:+ start:355469 stop:355942 length:474 start_codon:yes stop_codon:yes gene_type:complete
MQENDKEIRSVTSNMLEVRGKRPDFYKVMDGLMLANYKDCVIVDGQYVLTEHNLTVEVHLRSFYFHLDPTKYTDNVKFNKNGVWSNRLLKAGFKLTASTGNTYSYPELRDYIDKDNENDTILRASYFFACITQTVTFFSQRLGDMGFEKSTLINGDD